MIGGKFKNLGYLDDYEDAVGPIARILCNGSPNLLEAATWQNARSPRLPSSLVLYTLSPEYDYDISVDACGKPRGCVDQGVQERSPRPRPLAMPIDAVDAMGTVPTLLNGP